MIEVVIKISDEKYRAIQKCFESGFTLGMIDMAILNGTVLPKGHGRLKDVDVLVKKFCDGCDGDCTACKTFELRLLPTLVEADKEDKDA